MDEFAAGLSRASDLAFPIEMIVGAPSATVGEAADLPSALSQKSRRESHWRAAIKNAERGSSGAQLLGRRSDVAPNGCAVGPPSEPDQQGLNTSLSASPFKKLRGAGTRIGCARLRKPSAFCN